MTSYTHKKTLQKAVRKWMTSSKWTNPFAVTLNHKQVTTVLTERGPLPLHLDTTVASQNLRHFLNRMNKQFHGNAGQRYGLKLPTLPVLEGGKDKRFHYHLVMDLPSTADLSEVYSLIVHEWQQTQWGYGRTDIRPAYDENGWIDYITKLHSKSDIMDSIDWQNLHIPSLTTQ